MTLKLSWLFLQHLIVDFNFMAVNLMQYVYELSGLSSEKLGGGCTATVFNLERHLYSIVVRALSYNNTNKIPDIMIG